MSSASERALDTSHVNTWWHAMDLVGAMAIDGDRRQQDAEAFTLAFSLILRQVVRAVEFCRRHSPSRIDQALSAFEAQVPAWRDLRDIVEHFDDYDRGRGRLQKQGKMGDVLEWFEFDGTTRLLRIPPHTLDVAVAMEAASVLAGECLDAVLGSSD